MTEEFVGLRFQVKLQKLWQDLKQTADCSDLNRPYKRRMTFYSIFNNWMLKLLQYWCSFLRWQVLITDL